MSSAALARVSAKTAQEVAQGLPLGEPARKLLRPELTPQQFLDLLVEQFENPERQETCRMGAVLWH